MAAAQTTTPARKGPPMFTLTVSTAKYGTFTEKVDSLSGARLRASAVYYDCTVVITDEAGREYSRYGF